MTEAPLLVAQLTDIHLFADPEKFSKGVQTARSFQAVVDYLRKIQPQPDLLLLTGDLSNDETPESYQALWRSLAPLQIPTVWVPGNHDRPAVMEPILSQPPFLLVRSLHRSGWQILLLNSVLPETVHGELSLETLDWLDRTLADSPQTPTMITVHHPPLMLGAPWMDEINLHNWDALRRVIRRHVQVRMVVFGHLHQEVDQMREGVRYLCCPSTCAQFTSDRLSFGIDARNPGLRLFRLYPNGEYLTWVERVAVVPAAV